MGRDLRKFKSQYVLHKIDRTETANNHKKSSVERKRPIEWDIVVEKLWKELKISKEEAMTSENMGGVR